MIHNNEDMQEGSYVYSDEQYDYCIVNGYSLTKYYGPKGGDYESYPLHQLKNCSLILYENNWMRILLNIDSGTTKLYIRTDELRQALRGDCSAALEEAQDYLLTIYGEGVAGVCYALYVLSDGDPEQTDRLIIKLAYRHEEKDRKDKL